MHSLPIIIFSSSSNLQAITPTNDLRLEIDYHRRCAHAYSKHTENSFGS